MRRGASTRRRQRATTPALQNKSARCFYFSDFSLVSLTDKDEKQNLSTANITFMRQCKQMCEGKRNTDSQQTSDQGRL